jgi:hypothetical protein
MATLRLTSVMRVRELELQIIDVVNYKKRLQAHRRRGANRKLSGKYRYVRTLSLHPYMRNDSMTHWYNWLHDVSHSIHVCEMIQQICTTSHYNIEYILFTSHIHFWLPRLLPVEFTNIWLQLLSIPWSTSVRTLSHFYDIYLFAPRRRWACNRYFNYLCFIFDFLIFNPSLRMLIAALPSRQPRGIDQIVNLLRLSIVWV